MSCAWTDPRCRIGLILGTGTNACYLEEVKDIGTINREEYKEQDHMVSVVNVMCLIVVCSSILISLDHQHRVGSIW